MSASGNQFEGAHITDNDGFEIGRYVVAETANNADNLDADVEDGMATVPAGETADLVRWDVEGPLHLHALGSNDAQGCTWELVVDGDVRASTASPVGLVNDPFSFTDVLGKPLEAEKSIVYRVRNNSGQELKLAARAHIMVLG